MAIADGGAAAEVGLASPSCAAAEAVEAERCLSCLSARFFSMVFVSMRLISPLCRFMLVCRCGLWGLASLGGAFADTVAFELVARSYPGRGIAVV